VNAFKRLGRKYHRVDRVFIDICIMSECQKVKFWNCWRGRIFYRMSAKNSVTALKDVTKNNLKIHSL